MKVIKIHHPYKAADIPVEDLVLVMGFFDGVHRGHQEVIKRGKKEATERGLKLAVMTFNQHPAIVFQKIPVASMHYLTSPTQKEAHMEALGVDYLFIVEFTSAFASLAPQQFVDQYMVDLHAKVVVAGFDYTYGPRDIATMERLPDYVKGRLEIVTVPKYAPADEKISSTAIRHYLDTGQLDKVTEYLGYVYTTVGVVVHGDARGRTLGFPTANLKHAATVRLPQLGVYAVKIKVANQWYLGMAQIGHNVTFEANRQMTVEVNILDFEQDIYGEQVEVAWYHHLRSEIKFASVEGLIAQLEQDQQATRAFFATTKEGDV